MEPTADDLARARTRLEEGAAASGGPLPDAVLSSLLRYLAAVLDAGRDLNLTAATTLDTGVEVLALSSLAVRAAWPEGAPAPRRIVDLGSGNGFPGVVAALLWPEAETLLVERRAKKATAIGACCRRAGIANASAVPCDGRELLRERPEVRAGVDLVTARAVGTIEEAVKMAAAWLAPGGRLAVWKGANLQAPELEAGLRAARQAGLAALPEQRFAVPPGPARLLTFRTESDSRFNAGARRRPSRKGPR